MLKHFLVISWLLLFLGGCGKEEVPWHGRDISGYMPELNFELIDSQGRSVSADNTSGKIRLLYFGFTHCQNICPTTLSTLSASIRQLGPEADRVRVLFVSVDPKRDTPEVLKSYFGRFSPQVIGLSGSEKQLHDLSKRYRVSYSYGEPDAQGRYMVYHSSAVFVFDGRDRVRLLLDPEIGAEAIAEDLRRLLAESER